MSERHDAIAARPENARAHAEEANPFSPEHLAGLPDPEVVPLGPVATLVRRALLIVVIPAFAIYYTWQAATIEVPDRALAVSPRTFPMVVGYAMCAVSLLLAAIEVRRLLVNRGRAARGEQTQPEIDDDQERITGWRDAWVTLLGLVVYIATFEALGFFVSSVAFLIALSTYFAPRHIIRNVIVSAVFSIAIYQLFVNLLNVSLPDGVLAGVM